MALEELYSSDLKEHWIILLSVFGGVILVTGIVWLIMDLVIWKKTKAND